MESTSVLTKDFYAHSKELRYKNVKYADCDYFIFSQTSYDTNNILSFVEYRFQETNRALNNIVNRIDALTTQVNRLMDAIQFHPNGGVEVTASMKEFKSLQNSDL